LNHEEHEDREDNLVGRKKAQKAQEVKVILGFGFDPRQNLFVTLCVFCASLRPKDLPTFDFRP
jgi:hypothetical protein